MTSPERKTKKQLWAELLAARRVVEAAKNREIIYAELKATEISTAEHVIDAIQTRRFENDAEITAALAAFDAARKEGGE